MGQLKIAQNCFNRLNLGFTELGTTAGLEGCGTGVFRLKLTYKKIHKLKKLLFQHELFFTGSFYNWVFSI